MIHFDDKHFSFIKKTRLSQKILIIAIFGIQFPFKRKSKNDVKIARQAIFYFIVGILQTVRLRNKNIIKIKLIFLLQRQAKIAYFNLTFKIIFSTLLSVPHFCTLYVNCPFTVKLSYKNVTCHANLG